MEEKYKIVLSWYANTLDAKNNPITTLRTEEVEIYKLQRTVMAHSRLGMKLLRGAGTGDDYDNFVVEFVRTMVVDSRIREEISKDLFACVDLFQHEDVQKNISDFFESADFLNKAIVKNPQQNS